MDHDLTAGDVVKSRKSGKLYVVCKYYAGPQTSPEYISVRTLRDGQSFGPSHALLVADLEKTGGVANAR